MTLSRSIAFGILTAFVALAVACGNGSSVTEAPATAIHPTATVPATEVAVDSTSTASAGEISPELAAFLAGVDQAVSRIRGIPVAEPVPFRFLNDEELNAYVRDQIDDPEIRGEIAISDALYKLLGLIPVESDLFETYSALLDSQVLGAYDPEAEEFVVLQRGDTFGPSQEFTYAHEYVHRLQDAQFGLDGISERFERNSDQSLAFTALVEGDATTVQQIYALQELTFEELAQILAESSDAIGDSANAPYILRRGLEFPYVEGAAFAERLRNTQGASAIDGAFGDPPDSTEQILHVEKFVNREVPDEVTLPVNLFNAEGPLGEHWEVIDDDVFGEFFLKTWLEAIGARRSDAEDAAAGWGGDALKLAVNSDGQHAFAAKIVWDDSSTDAQEFQTVLTTIMAASPEFLSVDIGLPQIGVRAYEGDGGVIVVATFTGPENETFTALSAAPTVGEAMPLVLALAA